MNFVLKMFLGKEEEVYHRESIITLDFLPEVLGNAGFVVVSRCAVEEPFDERGKSISVTSKR